MRIARPRSASASTATAFAPSPRRRRGMSFFAFCLGTFLHLVSFVRGYGSRSELGHVAGRLRRRRRERQRQRDAYSGSFVPPLIGLARLEEGITDPLEIVGRDADAVIGDAKHQPRSLDTGGNRHP